MTTPLWRAMNDAFRSTCAYEEGAEVELLRGYAAELRAIAEELPVRVAFWGEGEAAIQALLRAEADRAEAGE